MNKQNPTLLDNNISLRSWATLFLLSIIWGTSYILIKKGVEVYSPYQVACLRLSISALAFLPVLVPIWKKIDWSKWGYLLLVGLTGTAIPSFMFPIAQTEISSSVAGILNSLTPLFTMVLGILIFSASFNWAKLLGVILGLVGAAGLIIMGNQVGLKGNMWFSLFVVIGCICYATSGNTVGVYLRNMKSVTISAVSFVMVGIPAAIILFTATDFMTTLHSHPEGWTALGYITLLALASTVFASILFFKLIQDTNPLFSSTVSYLVPAVAVLWGFLDGETISVMHFLAMILILLGVYLSRN
ncbi:MAG: EamA family transporter [Saprospiraceae bacterium]|nr:EamA family transporter [Saprospiraceae bacterium]